MKPNPILFSIPKNFETESDTFFDTKKKPKPNPILFSIPKIFETESDTVKKMKKFRNREVSKPKRHTLDDNDDNDDDNDDDDVFDRKG